MKIRNVTISRLFTVPACLIVFFVFQAFAEETLQIGLLCPLTGSYAKEARSQVNFAKMAAGQINAAGGVLGRRIEITVRDTRLSPTRAAQEAESLISNGVDFFIGGIYSSEVTAISLVARENNVLHVGLGGSNDLTGKYCNPYHFNLCPAGYQMARGTGDIVIDQLDIPKEWFAITVDYSWGHTTLASVEAMLEQKNGYLAGNAFVSLRESDFSAAITRAVTSGAPVLCIIVYGHGQAQLLNQIHDLGVKQKMLVVVIAANQEISAGLDPEVTENICVGLPWYWGLENKVTKQLSRDYMDVYGDPGDWPGALAWDSVHVIARAVSLAGSFVPEKVIPFLEGMEFETSKTLQKIRACDHRAIQDWYVGIGKPAALRQNMWDVYKIVGSADKNAIMTDCDDTGCLMHRDGD